MAERLAEVAIEEAIAQAADRIARSFSRASVPRGRPERARMAAARGAGASLRHQRGGELRRSAAGRRERSASAPITSASRSARSAKHSRMTFGTEGSPISLSTACASGATRDSARPRGDPARRDRRGAVRRDRRLDQRREPGALLAALRAVDPERSRRRRPRSRSPRTATASSWPKAPAPWCSRATRPRGARREDSRRRRRLRRARRLVPPHPLEPRRQADHRLHAQRHRRCRA